MSSIKALDQINTDFGILKNAGSFSVFPEASEQPLLTARAKAVLFSVVGDGPFCQRRLTHNSKVLVLEGFLMAEDVAQLAWLAQTITGY